MRVTVLPSKSATHTLPPPVAMPSGRPPTRIRSTTRTACGTPEAVGDGPVEGPEADGPDEFPEHADSTAIATGSIIATRIRTFGCT